MNSLIDDLLALQQVLARGAAAGAEGKATLTRLGAKLPPSVLAHVLRQHACSRAGVALVRRGVCSACHIHVARGTLQSLTHPTDLHLCENCGCFLALAPDEAPLPVAPAPAPAPRRPIGRPSGRRPAVVLMA